MAGPDEGFVTYLQWLLRDWGASREGGHTDQLDGEVWRCHPNCVDVSDAGCQGNYGDVNAMPIYWEAPRYSLLPMTLTDLQFDDSV